METPAPSPAPTLDERKIDIQIRKAEMVATEQTSFFNPIVYAQMKQMATDFIASQAIPKGISNAEQLIMVFQAGYEMGMKPVEAMNSLYIVNGKITLWGPAVLRRLRNFGYAVSYDESPDTCTATVSKGEERYSDTFTFEMAEKSGYTKGRDGLKIGWIQGANRVLKLRYGAISNIVKTYLPDVLGIYAGVAEIEIEAAERPTPRERIDAALEKRAEIPADFAPKAEE